LGRRRADSIRSGARGAVGVVGGGAVAGGRDGRPCARQLPGNEGAAEDFAQDLHQRARSLRVGVDDLRAGDAKSSVQALTYAAEGGEPLAQWKLGSMYASGEVVPRDDLMAYKYFEQLVDSYDEDSLDRRDIGAISNAFVAIGVYNLSGIPNSEITPDPERALEMFQFAATNFGDPEAQYHLARMYLDGAGGLAKDNMRAARWLQTGRRQGAPRRAGAARPSAVHGRRRPDSTRARPDVARDRQEAAPRAPATPGYAICRRGITTPPAKTIAKSV